MLSLLRAARSPRPLLQTSRCAAYARYFATEISDNASRDGAVNTSAAKEVVPELEIDEQQDLYDRPQRPPHGVTIDPNHGLYAFFRAFQQPDGQWERLTAQPKSAEDGYSGRSWSAAELRRKSFKDLHTLWYVLVRERNLLATQKEELRRLGVISIGERTDLPWRTHQCRKSMARIKYIINERRLAYEGAVELFAQDKAFAKIGALTPLAKETKTRGRMTPSRKARASAKSADVPTPSPSTAPVSA
ncbi:hypothetical protein HWV62_25200 [Athelia sp. TMB]|nr:hypothetical protein HWV62_25200 [Athelia sp. TMB]